MMPSCELWYSSLILRPEINHRTAKEQEKAYLLRADQGTLVKVPFAFLLCTNYSEQLICLLLLFSRIPFPLTTSLRRETGCLVGGPKKTSSNRGESQAALPQSLHVCSTRSHLHFFVLTPSILGWLHPTFVLHGRATRSLEYKLRKALCRGIGNQSNQTHFYRRLTLCTVLYHHLRVLQAHVVRHSRGPEAVISKTPQEEESWEL
ncbi:hypothetical protein ARMSODRAFT_558983 [Armillaria solidipes]|uniref:Uncharacterized protein n=1 Tax=Armillaria solidipes TaxID=1076256 RepID=A0A2H3BIR4_9AGAR|nr:hypothetical protein ARMSODRAFT_558983 [Armillaria solidipes]